MRGAPFFLAAVLFLCPVFIADVEAKFLLVEDFNDMAKPNFLGGDYGAWLFDWEDATQSCSASYDSAVKMGKAGSSMRLDYDVDSPNPSACGFWMLLERANLKQYDRLVFYVKGDEDKGYTTQFKVALSNAKQISRYTVGGVSSYWKRMEIAFSSFRELTDWGAMIKLAVIFDGSASPAKVGAIYIDDIYFSDKTREASKPQYRSAWPHTKDTANLVQTGLNSR